ncbi:MAG: biopolymer transporter ExbD [Kiritimatiellae bacterium]|nr:biopolymer transporter ExbD [Kiritimatiellia bacterium]
MRRKRGRVEELRIDMTPMIDIVFQMIIFFVVTIELEKQLFTESIQLAQSPHGPMIEQKDPRTVVVEVDHKGHILIAQTEVTPLQFYAIMRKAVKAGGQTTPVLIRGDSRTRHEDIRRCIDACTRAGLWKVSFAAIKEKAKTARGG